MRLRTFQREALQFLRKPIHLVCISPTGSGKSLIYERYAQQNAARILLVSPLLALARQQHQKLKALGLDARLGAGPDSEPPPPKSGIWIVSPEKLFFGSEEGRSTTRSKSEGLLQLWRPNFLVVDECHCLWEWGRDFRPHFKRLPSLLTDYPISKSLWLTATLPQAARAQLKQLLPPPSHFMGRFELPPLLDYKTLEVPFEQRIAATLCIVASMKGSGILFCNTRAITHRLARVLESQGVSYCIYHAGLSSEERTNLELMCKECPPKVVIATSAFGMGLDISHFQWCILFQPPLSLLALAQSIGRIARNGQKGRAFVLWSREDRELLSWASREALNQVYKHLKSKNPKISISCHFNSL